MKAISEVAAQTLPADSDLNIRQAEEQNASSQTIYIFILSLLFVYFLLSASMKVTCFRWLSFFRFRSD
jgi:HAE1 family hydrophobic/amphiphilic exporter-1